MNTDTILVTDAQTPQSVNSPTTILFLLVNTTTPTAQAINNEATSTPVQPTSTVPTKPEGMILSSTPVASVVTTTVPTTETAFGFVLGSEYFGVNPIRYTSIEEAEQQAQNWQGHYPHGAGEPFHDGTAVGPGDALLLSFANYANKVAYWTGNEAGQLWIADLELENPQLVYADEAQIFATGEDSLSSWFGKGDLIWTPDDLHVIFDPKDEALPNLIYHLESNSVEPWRWYCDRVALSPHTGQLATWCSALDGSSNFAVIEWRGEIWISPSAPEHELVRRREERPLLWDSNWAWSSDGQQIAYFDPANAEGRLFVADAGGVQQSLFPGAAWWLNSNTSRIGVPTKVIHWSQDGRRLLVYANDLMPDTCPDIEIMFDLTEGEPADVPCWHLLDTQDYTALWSWDDFIAASEEPSELTKFWRDYEASISSQGNYLMLTMLLEDNNVWSGIVRLDEGDVEILGNTPALAIRWRNEQ
ncbi:MAG: hypothetical protein HND44_18330 [Chloroflexi bacterium]|nr:hypothetical protein [Ardenticatenaceae bacterium]NOG36506.1 hypothetical protein [Chloroflexota bacterium]